MKKYFASPFIICSTLFLSSVSAANDTEVCGANVNIAGNPVQEETCNLTKVENTTENATGSTSENTAKNTTANLPKNASGTSTNTADTGLNFSGYIDGSYNYLVRSNHFTSGVNDRVFDLNTNGFTLQQAAFTLNDQPKNGFGGLVNVIAGRDALDIPSYGMESDIGIHNVGLDLTQAFVQYATGPFTLMAGKFIGIAGEEYIDPTEDTNFSRSILFGYAVPFTVTGIRGLYALTDKIKLIAGVNDGWDNVRDLSRDKTLELGMEYNIDPAFSFSVNGYTGQERIEPEVSTGPIGTRNLIDFFATWNVTDKLSLVTNYDYGWQTEAALPDGTVAEAIWQGIAGYVNYKFTDKWLTSFRAEIFDDKEGYRTGVVQVWKELTLTLAYLPTQKIEIRAETRHDFSNTDAFQDKNDINTSNNNQSFALEAFYKFELI